MRASMHEGFVTLLHACTVFSLPPNTTWYATGTAPGTSPDIIAMAVQWLELDGRKHILSGCIGQDHPPPARTASWVQCGPYYASALQPNCPATRFSHCT